MFPVRVELRAKRPLFRPWLAPRVRTIPPWAEDMFVSLANASAQAWILFSFSFVRCVSGIGFVALDSFAGLWRKRTFSSGLPRSTSG
jgi:hypothetical protein